MVFIICDLKLNLSQIHQTGQCYDQLLSLTIAISLFLFPFANYRLIQSHFFNWQQLKSLEVSISCNEVETVYSLQLVVWIVSGFSLEKKKRTCSCCAALVVVFKYRCVFTLPPPTHLPVLSHCQFSRVTGVIPKNTLLAYIFGHFIISKSLH